MPVLSSSALQALNFGYVSGADLAQWANMQPLISEYTQRPYLFQQAVNQAVSEVRSKLFNIYDLTSELSLPPILLPSATPVITGGVITGITNTSPGSGLYAAPTATVNDVTGAGATIVALTGGSSITGVEVMECGRHYTEAPAVAFIGGNPTAVATAAATIDGYGHVIGITITNPGSGYQSIPTVQITGTGIGAQAIALVTYGSVTGYTITDGGANYSAATSIALSGNYQSKDVREPKLVKLVSIFAIRNIFGSLENISDKMKMDFEYADNCIYDIRSGLDNLQLYKAAGQIRSDVRVVYDRFRQIG